MTNNLVDEVSNEMLCYLKVENIIQDESYIILVIKKKNYISKNQIHFSNILN